MRASTLFSAADRDAVAAAVKSAEAGTSAEIVAVVATASGRYDRAEDVFGLVCGCAAAALGWTVFQSATPVAGDWTEGTAYGFPLWAALATFVGGFWAGVIAGTLKPALKRPFVPRLEMEEEVERAAHAAFSRFRVARTAGATGVLLYASLFERRVRILGDAAVADALSQAEFDEVKDLLVAGLKDRRHADGFAKALARCGALLARSFPRSPDDKNELDNSLRLID